MGWECAYNGSVKRMFSILISIVFLCIFPQLVFAATVSFQNGKTSLVSPNDEYTIDVTLSINSSESYYLRGVFYKPGTTDYCGFTWNGNDWFSGPYTSNEGWKKFLPITLANNTWTGQVKAKIDSTDNGCKDTGEYKFKLQRFTALGGGTFDDQTEQSVQITIPTQTPTPSPTTEPTKTPTPTKAPTPTDTPVPSKVPSVKPTVSSGPSEAATVKKLSVDQITPTRSFVLGEKTAEEKALLHLEPSPLIQGQEHTTLSIGTIFVGIGAFFLIACGILAYYTWKKKTIA
jgi:hypothetical protein